MLKIVPKAASIDGTREEHFIELPPKVWSPEPEIRMFRSHANVVSPLASPRIISINSTFRISWDVFILILAIWSCLGLPFMLAFLPDEVYDTRALVFRYVTDFFFILDVVLNFRTSYIHLDTGEEVFCPKKIARRYMKSKVFYCDLLAAIPIDLVLRVFQSERSISMDILKMIKMVRILRISKLLCSMRFGGQTRTLVSMCQVIGYLLIYVHIIGCFFYLIVSKEKTWEPPTNSIFPRARSIYDAPLLIRYVYSIYHSVFLLAMIEASPTNTDEIVFCAVILLAGAIITANIFGKIAVIYEHLKAPENKFREKLGSINTTMKNIKLRTRLQLKINDFFYSSYHIVDRREEYEKFLSSLPPSLQIEVNRVIYSNIYRINPLFATNMLEYIERNLSNCFFQPEFTIISQFSPSDSIYFIADGKCDVHVLDQYKISHYIQSLEEGEMFGEVGLFYNTKRTASVVTSKYVNCAQLSKVHVDYLLEYYTEMKKIFKKSTCKYRDPWKSFLYKMLRTLPYMKDLGDFEANQLLYSLQEKNLCNNDILVNEGEICKNIYMVLEGSLGIYKDIIDKSLYQKLELKRKLSLSESKAESNSNKNVFYVSVLLKEAGPGSVICGQTALLGTEMGVTIKTKEPCKILILPITRIHEVAQNNSKISKNLCTYKKRLFEYDPYTESYLPKNIQLDLYCRFLKKERRVHKSMLKVKNVILMSIMRKRKMRKFKFMNLKIFVSTISAALEAEEKGKTEIAKDIVNRKVSTNAVSVFDMLTDKELRNPLLTQIASKVKETVSATSIIEGKLSRANDLNAILYQKIENTKSVMDSIDELMDRLTR